MADSLTALSRPYPWPWHGVFEPGRTALLVFRDGGIAPPDGETTGRLMSVVERAACIGVVIGELPGQAPAPEWLELKADFRVVRPHYGGFSGTDLDFELRKREITDLIFVGFPFELGADSTMRQANDLGYECLALTDCCSGLAPGTLTGAISSIQMSGGIFGAVAETAAILELFAKAGTQREHTQKESDDDHPDSG